MYTMKFSFAIIIICLYCKKYWYYLVFFQLTDYLLH